MIGRVTGVGAENLGHIFQRGMIVAQPGSDDGGPVIGFCSLGIGDIDQAVGVEIRIQRDPEITALSFSSGQRASRSTCVASPSPPAT
jgi:hypothetical protein